MRDDGAWALPSSVSSFSGNINANSHLINYLSNGISNSDAINLSQLKNAGTYITNNTLPINKLVLPNSGGNTYMADDGSFKSLPTGSILTQNLNASNFKITNLLNGSSNQDAATILQLNTANAYINNNSL